MKKTILGLLLSAFCLCSCDDNGIVGNVIQPEDDVLTAHSFKVNVETGSIMTDSVLSKSKYFLLGQYTDAMLGTTQAEFLTQLDARLGGVFIPDTNAVSSNSQTNGILNTLLTELDSKFGIITNITDPKDIVIDSVIFHFEYNNNFIGDSTSLQAISIYELEKTIPSSKKLFSNTDISEYCSKKNLLGTAAYQIKNNRTVRVPLDIEFGKKLAQIYMQDSKVKKQSDFNDIVKGLYVSHSFNEGGIVQVDVAGVLLYYSYDAMIHTTYSGRDTIVDSRKLTNKAGKKLNLLTTNFFLSANKAVERIDVIKHIGLDDAFENIKSNKKNTFTFTPSGLYTKVNIPVKDILDSLKKNNADTNKLVLNSAKLLLSKEDLNWGSKLSKSQNSYLLLIDKDSITDFFYNNKTPIKTNCFYANIDTSGKYAFDITYALNRIIKGDSMFNPENMVVVPITINSDNNTYTYNQDLWVTATMLHGSESDNTDKRPRIDIIYTERK